MKKVLVAFVLGLLVASAAFFAHDRHIILTDDSLVVERKARPGFERTFVDARNWGLVDYARNPDIAAILARRGLSNAANQVSKDAERASEKARDMLDGLRKKLE